MGQTLPIHWSGDFDELQDVELTIRNIQFGEGLISGEVYDSLGLPHAGLSLSLDALAVYLDSIEVPPSPYLNDSAAIMLGKKRFNALGCSSCHVPPLFTDLQRHDVGTGDTANQKNSQGLGTNFDTPSLRGIWMTAPYFHDGSAATLDDVFRTGTEHNISGERIDDEELEALIAYVRALPLAENIPAK